MTEFPLSKKTDTVLRNLESEVLVYNLKTNQVYCLNPTAAIVYELSDGKHSIQNIAEEMSKRMKTLVSEEMVALALSELKKNELMENSVNHFDGVSRRELIRKAGLTSMAALPIISALVAPKAANALSSLCAGICVRALDDICAPCARRPIIVDLYTSNDGSCTGPFLATSGNNDCAGFTTSARDMCIVGGC